MHILFIPYGKLSEVEKLIRDMNAQKHYLTVRKDGKEEKVPIESQVRILPGGIYEYICPREDMDAVLTTLRFHIPDSRYRIKGRKFFGIDMEKMLQKLLNYEPVPDFKTNQKYLWITEGVGIVPVGIRKDEDIVEQIKDKWLGWTHEEI